MVNYLICSSIIFYKLSSIYFPAFTYSQKIYCNQQKRIPNKPSTKMESSCPPIVIICDSLGSVLSIIDHSPETTINKKATNRISEYKTLIIITWIEQWIDHTIYTYCLLLFHFVARTFLQRFCNQNHGHLVLSLFGTKQSTITD